MVLRSSISGSMLTATDTWKCGTVVLLSTSRLAMVLRMPVSWMVLASRPAEGCMATGAEAVAAATGAAPPPPPLCAAAALGRAQHVALDDAAVGARAADRRQVHAVLFGQLAGQGRDADLAATTAAACGRLGRGLRSVGRAAAVGGGGGVATRRRRGLVTPPRVRVLDRVFDALALLGQNQNQVADRHGRALFDADLRHGGVVKHLHLHGRLVGFHVGDRVARGHAVALLDVPLEQRALFHGVGQAGHGDGDGHGQAFRGGEAVSRNLRSGVGRA